MDVYQAATTRRSIRRFKDAAVPYEILEALEDVLHRNTF